MSFVCPFSVQLIYTKFKKKLLISDLKNNNKKIFFIQYFYQFLN